MSWLFTYWKLCHNCAHTELAWRVNMLRHGIVSIGTTLKIHLQMFENACPKIEGWADKLIGDGLKLYGRELLEHRELASTDIVFGFHLHNAAYSELSMQRAQHAARLAAWTPQP